MVGGVTDALAAPDKPEKVSPQLDAALRVAHCSNPAQKSAAPLVRLLGYFGQANGTEIYGLCKGTFESPSMSRPMSKLLLASVLKWIGRVRADEQHPVYWSQLKDHFDLMITDDYQRAAAARVTRPAFIRGHRLELQLFLDLKKVTDVEAELESGNEVSPDDIESIVASSSIGSVLYAAESLDLESKQFCKDIKTRLYELEVTHQFAAPEFEAFKAIMIASADALDEDMWKQFDKKDVSLEFLGGTISGVVQNPNDEWQFLLEARTKTLGVSTGKLQRTVYERYLYGDEDAIPNVATQIKVPEAVLYDMANGREHINKMIGEQWQTTEQMKKSFRSAYAEGIKLDPTLWMDLDFLENEYEKLMERKLKNCMMEVLPLLGEQRQLSKAVVAARQLAIGDIAMAQHKKVQQALTAAGNFLQDVSEGRGPRADELRKWVSF